jgi:hypothetical protein
VIDPEREPVWQSCSICRARPVSERVTASALAERLPRGWQPLGAQRAVGPWAAELPCCAECGTCWLVWHDAAEALLEATAPIPGIAEPLLLAEAPLTSVLPLLRRSHRGAVRSWVHDRLDALALAWFAEAPLRCGTAAVGLVQLATEPGRVPAERATALRALTIVFERARAAGETLRGAWPTLLNDPVLRTSGPGVLEALRAAVAEALGTPPVLEAEPTATTRLARILDPIPDGRSDLSDRIRSAFRTRWQ